MKRELVMTWLLLEELSNFMKLAPRKALCSVNSIYLVGFSLLNWRVCSHKERKKCSSDQGQGVTITTWHINFRMSYKDFTNLLLSNSTPIFLLFPRLDLDSNDINSFQLNRSTDIILLHTPTEPVQKLFPLPGTLLTLLLPGNSTLSFQNQFRCKTILVPVKTQDHSTRILLQILVVVVGGVFGYPII